MNRVLSLQEFLEERLRAFARESASRREQEQTNKLVKNASIAERDARRMILGRLYTIAERQKDA